ncbi:glycosyltransferase family 2 protein [Candidatus Poribacteria bacterium]|nr:glycosyltransferase family 2 protein [Candidatus Poribacteria bacterium]
MSDRPSLSIVVPVYNEEECIADVLDELAESLDAAGMNDWECVVVNDGSRDRTLEILGGFTRRDPRFRVLDFVRNAGQTAAFDAGFRAARGEIVGMMDGDGQNDPRDFLRLVNELGRRRLDMVCGIRRKRKDSIVRKISSRVANGVRNWATHESVTDVGCSIRVFRRRCFRRIKLYKGMHRFFPTLFRIEGYRIGEIPVNHRPRTKGRSKYGIHNRLWVGIRDIFAVRWMQSRALQYRVRRGS